MGDKLGRKSVLMITITLMGGASTLVGMLPTGKQLGIGAPILLVFLRLCQGAGAGTEQAGSTVLMAEYSPAERRGFCRKSGSLFTCTRIYAARRRTLIGY